MILNNKNLELIYSFNKEIQKIKTLKCFILFLEKFFKESFKVKNLAFFYFSEIDSQYLIQEENFYSLNFSKNQKLKLSKKHTEIKCLEQTSNFFEVSIYKHFKHMISFKSKDKILAVMLVDNINSKIKNSILELEIISNMAGSHLEINQLKEIAIKDAKTDLYNYRYFIMQVKNEIRCQKRSDYKLSLLFLDLDNFKEFNNNYGHLAGDIILIEFSNYLKSLPPKNKILARYGGDEFCILYKNNIETSFKFAKNIQKNFDTKKLFSKHFSKLSVNLSLSIGISQYRENDKYENELIERADNALYQAKLKGKNQICIL